MMGNTTMNNRIYGQQQGVDWGKMALYAAGASVGYGVMRAGASGAVRGGKAAWDSGVAKDIRGWGEDVWRQNLKPNLLGADGVGRQALAFGNEGNMFGRAGADILNDQVISRLNKGASDEGRIVAREAEALTSRAVGFFSGANSRNIGGLKRAAIGGVRAVGGIAAAGLAINAARGAWNMFD